MIVISAFLSGYDRGIALIIGGIIGSIAGAVVPWKGLLEWLKR